MDMVIAKLKDRKEYVESRIKANHEVITKNEQWRIENLKEIAQLETAIKVLEDMGNE